MSNTRLLIVHARSPLHAGTGQATAAVDLPIARDRATNQPLLPGSSIKGSLRARARASIGKDKLEKEDIKALDWFNVFGPETEHASDQAGALSFSDARLLFLPVRSVAGTFAWVTSPYLLAVFAREAKLAGIGQMPTIPALKEEDCSVTAATLLKVDLGGKPTVVLEEFDLEAKFDADKMADYLAPLVFEDKDWQVLLKRRICIVHDDTMSFLAEHGTEVVTRVSIDPATGTAKQGQLWTEENLPAESVLVSLVEQHTTSKTKYKPGELLDLVQKQLLANPIQLGGKATVGRGRCALHLVHGGK